MTPLTSWVMRQFLASLTRDFQMVKKQTLSTSTRLLANAPASQNVHSICDSSQMSTRRINVEDPNFRSLFTPELEHLASIFRRYDHELRIAGGAVRDILTGRRPGDVDFATTATPAEMLDIFHAEDVRVVHDRGAAHGTLMVRVNDKEVGPWGRLHG